MEAVSHQITSPVFFEGGNAIFTVTNPMGKHYTYKIRHPDKKPFFVSLLTGPDNCTNYTYLGMYIPQNKTVKLTEKSKFTEDSTPVKVIRWAIQMIADNKPLPKGYSILHEGRCCRCGRLLTTQESIINGIGPECMKMM